MKDIKITPENIDALIAKEMEGSTLPSEANAIHAWRNQSEENDRYYMQIHQVNEMYQNGNVVNIDVAWSKMKDKMSTKSYSDSKSKSPKNTNNNWKYMAYAASVLLLFYVGVFLVGLPETTDHIATTNAPLQHKLEDGSIITLEKNSALSKMEHKNREYTFVGKATFTVKHDDLNPFIIHMDAVMVQDLGTIFEIEAVPGNDTVQVKVSEGSVQFFTVENKGLSLKEGEEAIYIKSKNRFLKRKIHVGKQVLNATFHSASIDEVMDYLSYAFRLDIQLENEDIKKCNITVDFSDAEYTIVKDIIQETLNLNMEDDGKKVTITGKGCP